MSQRPEPLDSCYAKLLRADVHIRALQESIQSFVDDRPYELEAEILSEEYPGEVIFYAREIRNPSDAEVVRWGVMVGDVVHCVRSALDHLAWQLTLSNTTEQQAQEITGRWKKVRFPVVRAWDADSESWFETICWGMSDSAKTRLREWQPATRRPENSELEPLSVLESLWNLDKHRTIQSVRLLVTISDIESVEPFPGVPPLNFDIAWKAELAVLEDGAMLARVRPRYDGVLKGISLPQLHMYPKLAFVVAFNDGPPAYGVEILESLRTLRAFAAELVNSLRSFVTVRAED